MSNGVSALGDLISQLLETYRLAARERDRALREDLARAWAASRGFTYWPEELDPFELLHLGLEHTRFSHLRSVHNPAAGRWRDREIVVFDLYQGDGFGSSCAITPLPIEAPDTLLGPRRLLHRVADRLGALQVAFESDRFNEAFEVLCGDRRFASTLIDARMMEHLLKLNAGEPRFTFELAGPWLFAMTAMLDVDLQTAVLDAACGVADRTPAAVFALYPSSSAPVRAHDPQDDVAGGP